MPCPSNSFMISITWDPSVVRKMALLMQIILTGAVPDSKSVVKNAFKSISPKSGAPSPIPDDFRTNTRFLSISNGLFS